VRYLDSLAGRQNIFRASVLSFYGSQTNICSVRVNESRLALIYSSEESKIFAKITRKLRGKEKKRINHTWCKRADQKGLQITVPTRLSFCHSASRRCVVFGGYMAPVVRNLHRLLRTRWCTLPFLL
jgi:hypothetical protein